ncbi:Calcineurin-like phosphoesterase domain-containing protein [Entamoeba marina]
MYFTDNKASVCFLLVTLAAALTACFSFDISIKYRVIMIILIVILAAIIYLITHYITFQTCTYKEISVTIPNLPDALKNKRLALVSDLHMDTNRSCISNRLLDESTQLLINSNPDAIFVLGDLLDSEFSAIDGLYDSFDKLSAICPVLAIYGNHDYVGGNPSTLNDDLAKHGVTVLPNGYGVRLFNGLDVVGLDDREQISSNVRVLEKYSTRNESEKVPVIVITHNPESVSEIAPYAVDLVFAGHTHGTQICTPRGVPLLKWWSKIPNAFWWSDKMRARMEAVLNMNYIYGLYNVTGTGSVARDIQLFVTRGVGSHAGIRACCEAEVVVVTLQ